MNLSLSALSVSLALKACSCLPLLVHAQFHCLRALLTFPQSLSDALSYSTSSESDFFQFLRRNPEPKEKANNETRCLEDYLK